MHDDAAQILQLTISELSAQRNRFRDALQEIAILTTDYDDFAPEYERVNAIAREALNAREPA